MIGLLSALQIVSADSITDTYNTGDTLTTTTLDNIKSAVNDNDARITALEAAAPGTNIANTAPTSNDDVNDGYSEGTTWIDVTSQQAYILVDSTAGSAVWKRITTAYEVGQIGPAGGIVIWIDNDTGTEGLEVSPVDLGTAEWGCIGIDITGADTTELFGGFTNTSDIIAECATNGIAARLADNYSLNGFNDWVLPSRDTLSELYAQRNFVSGLGSSSYWSSSEVDANNAYAHDFVGGVGTTNLKNTVRGVRAVRSF